MISRQRDELKKSTVALIFRDRTYTTPTLTADETALKNELIAKGYKVTTFYSGQVSGGDWGSGDGYKTRTAANLSVFDFIICCWDSEYLEYCSYCASPCSCPTFCASPGRTCVACEPE